ncbi:alpha/beta hydrolase [Enemella sp. A6]|uniref:alpha/beta hydrolase n=1 Tax=Enemella sp. A6 TaxID=3440152 RepID=UPI003EB6F461
MDNDMHPEVRAFLEALDAGAPDVHAYEPSELREIILSRRGPLEPDPPMAEVHDLTIDGPGGELPLRIYRPTAEADLPVVVFAHGGGFVFCDVDTHDEFCRTIAKQTGTLVISVDYRLAPEHRAPAAHDDFYAALQWAAEHAGEYGGDATRLFVAGDSAGGNLATTAALTARDRGGPAVAGQVLIYPVIDDDFESESYRNYGEGYYNTTSKMQWYWDQYADPDARDDQRIKPTVAESLAGLPPAVVVTAKFDPLCSEGDDYAERLGHEGVKVWHRRFDLFHGFVTFPTLPQSLEARTEIFAMMRELFAESAG